MPFHDILLILLLTDTKNLLQRIQEVVEA